MAGGWRLVVVGAGKTKQFGRVGSLSKINFKKMSPQCIIQSLGGVAVGASFGDPTGVPPYFKRAVDRQPGYGPRAS